MRLLAMSKQQDKLKIIGRASSSRAGISKQQQQTKTGLNTPRKLNRNQLHYKVMKGDDYVEFLQLLW